MDSVAEKLLICTRCKKALPLTEFLDDNRPKYIGTGKKIARCKKCRCAVTMESRKNPEVRLRHNENQRKLRSANPERTKSQTARDNARARESGYTAKWNSENRDKRRGYATASRLRNPQAAVASKQRWMARNPGYVRVTNARRRARERAAEGKYTLQDVNQKLESQKGRCWWCGCMCADRYHVDHVVPLARGGTNWPNNLVIACPKCNGEKHAKTPLEFAGRLF